MTQIEFYRRLKQHCLRNNADCRQCCLRLYCYTPPCEKTDCMMDQVIQYITEHTDMDDQIRSDHYTFARMPMCPLELDMTTAIGFHDRP